MVVALIAMVSFKNPEQPKPVQKQTLTLVCTTPELVKTYVDIYSKQGYLVKQVVPQSVSVNSRHNDMDDLYGKFILILEK
jgi:hypothetical protein